MNLFKNIFSVYNENTHKVICILGFKIKFRILKEELKMLYRQIAESDRKNLCRIMKLLPANSIRLLEIHIVDHCNLNCKGCHHFAPLAPESYLSLAEFEKDLTRLFELTNGEIETFNIMGGEPLLHPQCVDFLETARRIFPKSNIKLITNGILLPEMPDSFYEKCAKNNIYIRSSKYPIDIDWELIKERCNKFGVSFQFYLVDKDIMYEEVTDLTSSQKALMSFYNCQLGWHYYFYLDHGKIYHCSKTAYFRFFNDYFKQNIKVPETDYIDIYKVNDIQEILDFMVTPPKFCSHCIKQGKSKTYKWEKSKKEIAEWI